MLEGATCTETTPPILYYGHDQGCSVTGGVVYRGRELPQLQGAFLYGDYCSGIIWIAGEEDGGEGGWESLVLFDTEALISAFGTDEAGEIYFTDYALGLLFKIVNGSVNDAAAIR